jgi:hypothetical protein
MSRPLLPAVLALLAATPVAAADERTAGHVQIPVEVYERLMAPVRDPSRGPRPALSGYALGNARVTLTVPDAEPQPTAQVQVDLTLEVLDDQWVLAPVLPAGTAVDSVTVGGTPVALAAGPAGLGWITNKKGSHAMTLRYRVDAQRSPGGFTLAVPVPAAASIVLAATLPGPGLEVTVIPATGVRTTPAGSVTRVEATIPAASGVQISWRAPSGRGHALSRARYTGRLVGDAVAWTGELGVDLFGGATTTVPLLPRGVTLRTLSVDGRDAAVLVEGGQLATLVKGAGTHLIRVGFETPVVRGDGPPSVELKIPEAPISRFDLTLPGRKELKATPASSVTTRAEGSDTVATVHVPLTDRLTLAWSEAVPDDAKAEARTSAALYHAAHAEEGVLYVHARVHYEVSRGAVGKLQLLVPAGVQVDRIESSGGELADWRLALAPPGRPRLATVFLNREVTGELTLDVHYDRSLGAPGVDLELPLLRAADAQRQRGMVALLAGADLTLDPQDEVAGTRVGENQLPAFVREGIERTVAHTFKYVEEPPRFVVRARTPDAVTGKFDAQVDTLVSLGEVTLTGAASVEIRVKSGRLSAVQLELPADVTLLSLTGPSLRSHRAATADGRLVVDVAFTQEMEGEFRLDVGYERILAPAPGESPVEVPTLRVRGVEVEQGRIAVEAVSAVEVRPAAAEQLAVVDVAELPQQLVLRTTHPILVAYKYLHAEPPHRLTLGLTRHRLAGIQEATIDRARYRTLVTPDGLEVTTAVFTVRNSRQQFLKLRLPKGVAVWSASVDGKAEKPAVSDDGDNTTVLLKIVHSTSGFPVQIVFATQGPGFGAGGSLRSVLPRPDLLVTHSRWDLYLPAGIRYGSPSTNMQELDDDEAPAEEPPLASPGGDAAAGPGAGRLTFDVPKTGVHYAFAKLYANQAEQESWVRIPYASPTGAVLGRVFSVVGALTFWLGLGLLLRPHPSFPQTSRRLSLGLAGGGLLAVLGCLTLYHVGPLAALLTSVAVWVAAAAAYGRKWLDTRRATGSPAGDGRP